MENRGPWMPGPGLFLLLLLPPLLLSAGSFNHSILDWRNFQRLGLGCKNIQRYLNTGWRNLEKGKANKLYDYDGDFDLYFILDV